MAARAYGVAVLELRVGCTCLQSGTLQILTMCDHEPVAQRPEPGAKATAEMGRSSPKLESWFCTPRSSPGMGGVAGLAAAGGGKQATCTCTSKMA